MEEIRMFEDNPMNGSIRHTAAGGEFDAIPVVAECWIVGTLQPETNGWAQQKPEGTAFAGACPSC